jgi:transcriptional regulator with XRE-family HTH domain
MGKAQTNIRAYIGETIAVLRQRRGWTQSQLGEATGFKRQAIGRIENGGCAASIEIIDTILSALGARLKIETNEQSSPK